MRLGSVVSRMSDNGLELVAAGGHVGGQTAAEATGRGCTIGIGGSADNRIGSGFEMS